MLGDYAVLLVAAVLVNNFVLVQFLGLCPFMGVSNKLDTAIGMSAATTFVLTLASVCSYLTYRYLLEPLDLTYLRTLSFILVIAVVVQFTEMVVRKTSPLLHRVLGVYLPPTALPDGHQQSVPSAQLLPHIFRRFVLQNCAFAV